ncbi:MULTISPECIES: hypothetical protein [Trueperella]|uniref:TadE-like protein n=1 Tax=Trueperella bernardiae TaxID=59561 RepID=A0A0W1KJK9_9ACTO|nr:MULTISPECIES: hypothetical protein [Trueperella]KTF03808.1 hypothetical protein AQZ59_01407 [Trueperella bernardiae]MCM3907468.1 hypothetical protein [Trueperella bernardiae]MDK8602325.1 hypothetical protein [Trueperella bernardiae]OFS68741.1 hypothetical protein HMPREF3174_00065 [Trueperella sp. HMSC08H06]OFS76384.1 hypothetical protein HMPREF3167_00780 [Trueperella sp. HMSC08B05]
MWRANKPRGEDGNAIVEFVGVMVVIVVPALALLTGLATTTTVQLALEDAARQSARAYVRAESVYSGEARGREAASKAWTDRGMDEQLDLNFACSASPCLSPGATVTARASATVTVPIVGAITLTGEQAMVVDQYRVVRP